MLERLLHFVTGSPAFQFLRSVTPFDFLSDPELKRATDALTIEYHAVGSTIFVQGQSQVSDVYVVLKGALEVIKGSPEVVDDPVSQGDPDQQGSVSRLLGVGQAYGAASILTNGGIALSTVRAHQDTFLYALPKSLFLELCTAHREFHDFFADALGPRMLERVGLTLRQKWLVGVPESDALRFGLTVGEICARDLTWCDASASIREAAQRMLSRRVPTLLVGDGVRLAGVVTERRLLEKVVAAGVDVSRAVSEVMTPPAAPVAASTPLADAMEVMVRANVGSLPVADSRGTIVGLLTDQELLVAQGSSPMDYLRDLAQTRLIKDLAERRSRLPRLARTLMLEGSRIESLTWLVSTVSDTTLRRLLDMGIDEMGEPPVPFVFLTLGSEGRREQTLVTDQDNAIVYADVAGKEELSARYFAQLGERVCAWLKEVGIAYCHAHVMASNPQWCQSLSAWKDYFTGWVRVPDPKAVLNSNIFFDFREIYGDFSIAKELRAHVRELLEPRPGLFFRLVAQEVVRQRLPVGLFGRVVVETRGKREDVFDIKLPISRIADLARLHALWHGVEPPNTLERLRLLAGRSVLDARQCLDLQHAYCFLMQLRLAKQLSALNEGAELDNLISVQEISSLEQKFLEDTFRLIERVQEITRRRFVRTV
jgi:CBS domain-containing protein